MAASGKGPPAGATIAWFVALDFVAGIFLVWLYAAVRPRMGAGPATAAKAGVAAWFIGNALVTAFMWPMGFMPHSFMISTTIIALVEWPLAAVIGAKFYTEGAGVGAGMGAGVGARM
jgi:hypothetical protein